MGIHYVDFTPKLLEAESQFSTLSLTGDIPGPQYEDFETAFRRASEWLYRQKNVEPINCEVVELTGVYQVGADTESVTHPAATVSDKKGIPSFLKVIRIWYRRLDGWQPVSDISDRVILKYYNLMPARLESTPRAFGPKFQSLNDAIQSLNRRLQDDPDTIKGRLLSIQTSVCRFSTKHCAIDPDRTFWMANNTEDMHVSYFFRIFYIKSKAKRPQYSIGYQDFAPQCDWKSKRRRDQLTDNFTSLLQQADDWQRSNPAVTVLNCDSVIHHAYYRCARDSPGMETRVLDNPHFRSTLWGLMDYARVLRVFYTQQVPPHEGSTDRYHLVSKVFHAHPSVATDSIRFASVTSQIPLNHDQLVHKINDWIKQTGVTVQGVETVKILSNLTKVSISADDTVFQGANRGPTYALFGLRLYISVPESSDSSHKLPDLSPDPKSVRLDEDSCSIL